MSIYSVGKFIAPPLASKRQTQFNEFLTLVVVASDLFDRRHQPNIAGLVFFYVAVPEVSLLLNL
jgi:hypothetical protein